MAEDEKIYEPEEKKNSQETAPEQKGGNFFLRNKKNFFVFGGIILLILVIVFGYFLLKPHKQIQKISTCGDGTLYNTCSLTRPYYCNYGKLVENSKLCGCPENFTVSGNSCINMFFTGAKNISFAYYLNGKKGEINLTLYKGISKYMNSLPNTITYYGSEVPRLDDFELKRIDNSVQSQALSPLLIAIENAAPNSTTDQLRIAISIVQNIPYGGADAVPVFGGKYQVSLARYPYQVLYYDNASCEGKSELLAFISRKIGYGTVLFYYPKQNHEAVGISCPVRYSLNSSGYCFVETTSPAPISYSTGIYVGEGNLTLNNPEIVLLGPGKSLPDKIPEYKDAIKLTKIVNRNLFTGRTNYFERKAFEKLKEKYMLNYVL